MKRDLRVTCGSRLDVPAASASDDPNAKQNMRRSKGAVWKQKLIKRKLTVCVTRARLRCGPSLVAPRLS